MRTNVLLRTGLNRLNKCPYSGRLWPNGEFGLGKRRLTDGYGRAPLAVAGCPSADDREYKEWMLSGAGDFNLSRKDALRILHPGFDAAVLGVAGGSPALGLADAPNSHKASQRRKRGSRGITSLQRRMIRNGAYLLQCAVTKFRMGMLTTTIPPVSAEGWRQYADNWPEIVRRFLQELSRALGRAKCRTWIVGCTELQEERLLGSGGYPLHLHVVFQCRRGKSYAYEPPFYRELWKRTVARFVPELASKSFCAACRIESIEKDASKYLSKYASKGVSGTVLEGVSVDYACPGTWAHLSGGLKRCILRQVRMFSERQIDELTRWIRKSPHRFTYLGETWIDTPVGERVVAYYGELTRPSVALLRSISAEERGHKEFVMGYKVPAESLY